MAGVGAEIAGKFLKALAIEAAAWLAWKGIKNLISGKTLFGKEKTVSEQKEQTYVDWHGNVILGTNDFAVE